MGDEMWCCTSWAYMENSYYEINNNTYNENSVWINDDLFDCLKRGQQGPS